MPSMRPVWWSAASVLLVVAILVIPRFMLGTHMAAGIIPVGREPDAIAVDERTGRAFVTNSADNTVTMFDTSSGAVLRTISMGRAPGAVLVDARSDRAFVLNVDDASVSTLDATTGEVVDTINVPNAAVMTMDEQSGHVFVSGNSTSRAPGTVVTMLEGVHRLPCLHSPKSGPRPHLG